jgi:hypothetical protein
MLTGDWGYVSAGGPYGRKFFSSYEGNVAAVGNGTYAPKLVINYTEF